MDRRTVVSSPDRRGSRSRIGGLLYVTAMSTLALTLVACNLRPFVRASMRWGYMDRAGRIVIPITYTRAYGFAEGLAGVKIDDKWAFIDRTGKVVIPARFGQVCDFKGGLARVETAADKWQYIDRSGQVSIDLAFKYSIFARDFSEGLAAVYIENPARFECLGHVEQDRREDYDGMRGYINTSFCGRWGFIDQKGTFVIEPQFIEAFDFSEGLAAVRIRQVNAPQAQWLCGYIDRTGNVVIEPRFDGAFDFSDGIARVVVAGRRGFIDKNGKWVVEAKFDDARDFHEGLAAVKIADRWGYIDTSGKMPAHFQRDLQM
jgi:hypothetical protein